MPVILCLLRWRFGHKEIGRPKYELYPLSFSRTKNLYFKCERSRRDATKGLCSPKANTKMPTRTKSVEMNLIVTNSEINLHNCLCESRGFKIGRSSQRRSSIKKGVLKNFAKVTG